MPDASAVVPAKSRAIPAQVEGSPESPRPAAAIPPSSPCVAYGVDNVTCWSAVVELPGLLTELPVRHEYSSLGASAARALRRLGASGLSAAISPTRDLRARTSDEPWRTTWRLSFASAWWRSHYCGDQANVVHRASVYDSGR